MTARRLAAPVIAVIVSSMPLGACRPAAPACPDCAAHEAEVARWREERLAALRAEQSWLSLAGLFWLDEGEHRLGADPSADLVFPAGAPREIGALTRRGDEVRLRVAPGVDARIDGAPVTEVALRSDADEARPADRVTIAGRFVFLILVRGGRVGLRLYDTHSPERRAFAGIEAFPVRPEWRVRARFEAFTPPRTIEHPTVIGATRAEVPGVAIFTVAGQEHRLTPILETGPKGQELLFLFRDRTSGVETYTGGRFLVTEMPRGGFVELDFNRAHNPPCAFTAYATCPLPREENHLPIRVEAGEKTWAGPHDP